MVENESSPTLESLAADLAALRESLEALRKTVSLLAVCNHCGTVVFGPAESVTKVDAGPGPVEGTRQFKIYCARCQHRASGIHIVHG